MDNSPHFIDTILDIGRQCLLQRQELSTEADITPVDFAVIEAIRPGEKLSCKDLADTMDLSSSRCSRIVDRLQNEGYLERRQNGDDRRAIEVSLTEKGCALRENIERLKEECEKRILSNMNEREMSTVKEGMRILRTSLHASRQG